MKPEKKDTNHVKKVYSLSVGFYEDAHKLYNGFDFLTKEFASEKELTQFIEELKLKYPNLQFIKNL